MRSLPKLSLSSLCLALVLWGVYGLIGTRVDEDGWLREPFLLIPLGWLCLFAAAAFASGWFAARLRERPRDRVQR